MNKLEKLEKILSVFERINTVTIFVLPPLTAIYGVWSGDWRQFKTAIIVGIAMLVMGLIVAYQRDTEKSK